MASRISRKVCTLGRPVALGTGRWGSMQDHSASDKSVWYALLMLGNLPSYSLKLPFRTPLLRGWVNKGIKEGQDMESRPSPLLASVLVASPSLAFLLSAPQQGVGGPARRFRHPAYCARDRAQRPR